MHTAAKCVQGVVASAAILVRDEQSCRVMRAKRECRALCSGCRLALDEVEQSRILLQQPAGWCVSVARKQLLVPVRWEHGHAALQRITCGRAPCP